MKREDGGICGGGERRYPSLGGLWTHSARSHILWYEFATFAFRNEAPSCHPPVAVLAASIRVQPLSRARRHGNVKARVPTFPLIFLFPPFLAVGRCYVHVRRRTPAQTRPKEAADCGRNWRRNKSYSGELERGGNRWKEGEGVGNYLRMKGCGLLVLMLLYFFVYFVCGFCEKLKL